MAYTILSGDPRAVGTPNPAGDMNNANDVLTGMGAVYNVLNTAWAGGADPSGAADSTAAIQAALTAAGNASALGQWVYVPPGTYKTTAPLVVPPAVWLRGAFGNTISLTGYGAVIKPAVSWAQGGAAGAGVILLLSQTAGGYGSVSEEQKISGITIDGSNLTGTVDGILVVGNVGSVTVAGTAVNEVTGVGFHGIADAGAHNPSGVWDVDQLTVHRAGTNGINFTATDMIWRNCYVIGSGQASPSDGWVMGTCSNSTFIGCRSEDSIGGNGFTYTCSNNLGNGVTFDGCSTQGNANYGIELTATSGGANAAPIHFTGCNFNEDGVNGGSGGGGYASIYVTAYDSQVMFDGCAIVPGKQFTTGAAQYGLKVASAGASCNISFSNCQVAGATLPFSSDGTGSVVFDATCVLQAGVGGSSPTVWRPGVTTQISVAGNLVPGPRTDLAAMPAGTTGMTIDRHSATSNSAITGASGTLYMGLLLLIAGCPVNNLNFFQGSTVETAGSHGWMVISDPNKIVRAVTSDQTGTTSFGTANSTVSLPVTVSWTPPTTGYYYIGVCTSVASGNTPNWVCGAGAATSLAAGITPTMFGTAGTANSTPPALSSTLSTLIGVAADNIFGWAS